MFFLGIDETICFFYYVIKGNKKFHKELCFMDKQRISMLLKEARKKKKLTHQNVVDRSKIPITRQYYGAIERGERTPKVNVAKQIATILDIDWVIFFEDDVN